MPRDGYRCRMSDHDKDENTRPKDEEHHNTPGVPSGDSQDADTASGGAPDDADSDSGK